MYYDWFTNGRAHIVRFDRHASNRVGLTQGNFIDTHPVLSSDGTKIAFARQRGKYQHVWIMDTSGENQRQITDGAMIDSPHTFSPDASLVYFVRTTYRRFGNLPTREIYSVSADGKGAPALVGEGLAIAPDGGTILLEKFDLRSRQNGIYLRDAHGGKARLITTGYSASFSPDGRWISYVTQNPDYSCEIMLRELSSGKEGKLPTPYGYKTGPVFVQHGQAVTFRIPASRRDGPGGMYVIDLTRLEYSKLVPDSGGMTPRIPTEADRLDSESKNSN